MKKLLLFLLSIPAFAQVTITAQNPQYNWQVLAGSVREISAVLVNGTGNLVNFSVASTTGGATATLGCTSSCIPTTTVTLGSTSGTCSISGSIGSYSVTSTASVTIQVQSVDDTSKTDTFLFNVCNPAVQVYITPFYRVLYKNQRANLQSWIVGSTNLAVTWSITTQPGGGDGSLDDTTNQDTVFHATVAGRYTITATSSADGTKTATTLMYVTGNTQPYNTTKSLTEPIDPTVDAGASGTTYIVAPDGSGTSNCGAGSSACTTIQSVPMNTMPAGSTVVIKNIDLSGTNPTTYAEYFQLGRVAGTPTQPIRVVCSPDSAGNLPIITGQNATGASWVSTGAAAGFGVASVWSTTHYGFYQQALSLAQNIIIEGCHFTHASHLYSYTPPSGGAPVAWVTGAACVNIRIGTNINVVGNEMDHCDNGTFSDSNLNSNAWQGQTLNILWEGNSIHDDAFPGSTSQHQLYIQDILHVVQFNRICNDQATGNSNMKTRSNGEVVRYNYFCNGPARQIDMVELQDSSSYFQFSSYCGSSNCGYLSAPGINTCASSYYCLGDTMGANILAAWQEVYSHTWLYGNVINNTTAQSMVHYNGDNGQSGLLNRRGNLSYYNNTIYLGTSNVGGFGSINFWIDTDNNGGGNPFEFPRVTFQNNIIWSTSAVSPVFPYVNKINTLISTHVTNLLNLDNPISYTAPLNGGAPSAHAGNGWSSNPFQGQGSYNLTIPLSGHTSGLSAGNFLTTGTQPFNSTSYLPVSPQNGSALAGDMALMPVRFMYQPDLSYAVARNAVVNSSTGGQIGALDSPTTPTLPTITSTCPGTPGTQNVVYSGYQSTATGSTPFTWGIGTGALPAGLSQNTSTGLISGTPTGTGTSNFQVTVTNGTGTGTNSPQSCSIVISAPTAPTITSACPLPAGTQNNFYSFTLTASGATPLTWGTTSGTLPTGLTLNTSTGLISGTPTGTGASTFSNTVSNAGGSGSNSPQSCSLTIATASQSQPAGAVH